MSKPAHARGALTRFVLAGGIAAVLNWVAGRVLAPIFGLDAAVVMGYCVGMITAFLLNRAYVFEKSGRPAGQEFFRFALVNAVSVVIVWAVTSLLARVIFPSLAFRWNSEAIAHAIGILSPIIPSFLMHRAFSFARMRRPTEISE